ncbi:TPA: DUF551 domain-containing protein [Klebsiella variicola subsp. variicola]
MTKSTITRERLEQLADNNTICKVSWDERIELAQIALAAMDSEPVAEVLSNRPGNDTSTIDRALPFGTQLYRHAQPAPVVPEKCPAEIRDLISSHTDALFNDDDAQEIWNACRSAMLEADPQLPGSEPATVPGKWIPVSERLPEAGGDMIVFTDGIVMSGVSYAKKKGFYIQALEYDDDEPVDSVTHWMSLPSAPQEVKGE